MSQVSCAIFDLDGTLLDTEPFYAQVNQEVINEFGNGLAYDWARRRLFMGKKAALTNDLFRELFAIRLSVEEVTRVREERLERLFRHSPALPGALELLRAIKARGIPVALATSSTRRLVDLKLADHPEMRSLLDHLVCGDDAVVQRSKPAPDIVIRAAALCGVQDMARSVIFEDSALGVVAAVAAGAVVVAVPDAHLRDDAVFARADFLLPDLRAVRPEMLRARTNTATQ